MKKFIFGLIGVVIVVAGFFLYDREDYTTDDMIMYEYKKEPAKKASQQEPKRKSFSALKGEEVEMLKKVQESDSKFAEEMVVWDELQRIMNSFYMDMTNHECYGGFGNAPALEKMRNCVLEVRVKDLHRILQLEGGSDPASDGMVEYKKAELLKAIERASKLVIPIEERMTIINGEEIARCRQLFEHIQQQAELLPEAIEKWIKTRSRYKGCTAIALDDMKDVVNSTHPGSQENIDEEEENTKDLNSIRFDYFKKEDWMDNEYIRELRRFIDEYRSGKIEKESFIMNNTPILDKKELRGKFVVGDTEPFIGGGLYIEIAFVEHPVDIYSAWIYSYVDEEKEVVTGYECRMFRKEKGRRTGFKTKEALLNKIKGRADIKMW